MLGVLYAFGAGVPKDTSEALKWLLKAAEQGLAKAQVALGMLYDGAEGVPKNTKEAFKWYLLAAMQGHAFSQFNVGLSYQKGEGASKDEIEAAKWLRKAAEQGLVQAQSALGFLYDRGEGVPKNTAEAFKWYLLAAQQGDADCQFSVGRMYQNGDGVAKDDGEAVKWYRRAAEQGDAFCQLAVGTMYQNGEGVSKDDVEALKRYRKAAEHGYPAAQLNLGWMYAIGAGVPKNSSEAVKFYRLAAVQGNAQAQFNLGVHYADGDGVVKDSIEGLAWLNIAAMNGPESWVRDRNMLERRIGPNGTLTAQQRSKQILRDIDAAKSARKASANDRLPSADSDTAENQKPKASGSGAIVAAQGHVLTAAHVVVGAKRVIVTTKQGVKNATILQVDEANDLAVLKITDGSYLPLPIAPSRKMRLGQIVATIGFPNTEIQGFSPKVTRGEISSLNGIGDDPRAWQISVPVQTGNSGGPLLDENGNLVGVVVSKLGLKAAKLTGDLPQNVNYAVKSAYALALLEPYLGSDPPEPNQTSTKPRFEDMVAKAQQSVVLVLVY